MDVKILEEFKAAFGQELALAGDDFGFLETAAIQDKMRQLGQGLLQPLLLGSLADVKAVLAL